jgi:hypothetical protein
MDGADLAEEWMSRGAARENMCRNVKSITEAAGGGRAHIMLCAVISLTLYQHKKPQKLDLNVF